MKPDAASRRNGSYAKVSDCLQLTLCGGSTMGYELNAHGLPTLFLDPSGRCTFLPNPDVGWLNGLRITSYESFCDSLLCILNDSNANKGLRLNDLDDLCLDSSNVSERVYAVLVGQVE